MVSASWLTMVFLQIFKCFSAFVQDVPFLCLNIVSASWLTMVILQASSTSSLWLEVSFVLQLSVFCLQHEIWQTHSVGNEAPISTPLIFTYIGVYLEFTLWVWRSPSLLCLGEFVHFVNTDYKSWPDFILVYNDGKTEDQCPLYGHVNCLCVFRLLELIACETLTLHLLPCGRPWTLWGRGARGAQGTGKERFVFHFPINLCLKMSYSWNFSVP